MKFSSDKIAILGLGYVGLPLAKAFSKKFNVIGFDINKKKIDILKKTLNIKKKKFRFNNSIIFTSNKNFLKDTNIFIVTVPTPVKKNKSPDLNHLISVSALIGKNLKKK